MPIFTAKVLGWCRCRPSDSKYPQIDVDPNSDVAKRVSIAPPHPVFPIHPITILVFLRRFQVLHLLWAKP